MPAQQPKSFGDILADIAISHPNGGADWHKEIAKRYMADGGTSDVPGQAPPSAAVEPPEDQPDYSGGTTPGEKAGISDASYINPNSTRVNPITLAEGEQARAPIAQPIPPPAAPESENPGTASPAQPPAPAKPAPAPSRPAGPSANDKQLLGSLNAQADIAGKQGAAEANANQPLIDAATQEAQRDRDFQNFVRQHQLDVIQRHDQMVNEYANATVDPNRYWNGLDTGHKILASLSMILSGGGGSVQAHIDNDIEAQKDQIERKGKAAGMLNDIFNQYRDMGMDSRAAMQAAVTTAKDVGAMNTTQMAARFAGPMAQAKVGQQFQQQRAVNDAQLADAALKSATARKTNYDLAQSQKQAKYWEDQLGLPPGVTGAGLVTDGVGRQGVALGGADDAKAFNADAAPAITVLNTLKEIEKARQSGLIQNQGQLQAYGLRLNQALAKIGGGDLTQRTADLIKQGAGNPMQYFALTPGSLWSEHAKGLQNIANQQIAQSAAEHNVRWLNGGPPQPFPEHSKEARK